MDRTSAGEADSISSLLPADENSNSRRGLGNITPARSNESLSYDAAGVLGEVTEPTAPTLPLLPAANYMLADIVKEINTRTQEAVLRRQAEAIWGTQGWKKSFEAWSAKH